MTSRAETTIQHRDSRTPSLGQVVIVLLVCAVVYLPRLGVDGLTGSEGHRAIPAWEMLATGNWLTPRLFEQVYLRKPPGIAWAIAASSAVFGQTEFAARFVSVVASTVMALVAMLFAARWFGRRWALAAGLAQGLLPVAWVVGRTAEIEALHNLAVQVACLSLFHALVYGSRGIAVNGVASGAPGIVRLWPAVLAGFSVAAAGLLKGPAGLPCVAAVVLGACVAARSLRPLLGHAIPVAVTVTVCVLVPIAVVVIDAARGEQIVWQSPGEFLWRGDRVGRILLLAPLAFASALPAAAALVFPWGSVAQREAVDEVAAERVRIARGLSSAWLFALAIYVALGVDNPRYAMPAIAFIAPVMTYVFRGAFGGFTRQRRIIARVLMLHSPAAWPVGLVIAALIGIYAVGPSPPHRDGRRAGELLAANIADRLGPTPGPLEIWADNLVEARPEVLWYATHEAPRHGLVLRPKWVPQSISADLPAPGHLIVLRTDDLSLEHLRFADDPRLEPVADGELRMYRYTVYRVRR